MITEIFLRFWDTIGNLYILRRLYIILLRGWPPLVLHEIYLIPATSIPEPSQFEVVIFALDKDKSAKIKMGDSEGNTRGAWLKR